jgi:hypothetical protein
MEEMTQGEEYVKTKEDSGLRLKLCFVRVALPFCSEVMERGKALVRFLLGRCIEDLVFPQFRGIQREHCLG